MAKEVTGLLPPYYVTNGTWVVEVKKPRLMATPLLAFDFGGVATQREELTLDHCEVDGDGFAVQRGVQASLEYPEGGGTVFRVPGYAITQIDKHEAQRVAEMKATKLSPENRIRWRIVDPLERLNDGQTYAMGEGELEAFVWTWDRWSNTLFMHGPRNPTDEEKAAAAELWFDKVMA